jgi:hypothetical protein
MLNSVVGEMIMFFFKLYYFSALMIFMMVIIGVLCKLLYDICRIYIKHNYKGNLDGRI